MDFKKYEDMSKAELIAELNRAARLDAPHLPGVALQELHTYKEETRVQTEQLIEAQRLLEQSRDRYAELYEFAPVAFLTLDEEGLIRDINLTGARLLARERSSILDRPFVRFVSETHRRAWLDHFQAWSRGEEGPFIAQLRLGLNGELVDVEMITRRVDCQGEPVFNSALVDMTQQKRSEQDVRDINALLEERVRQRTQELESAVGELRAADQRKNEFLAMLGHELRNPLASISNGLALLMVSDLRPEEHAEAIRIMDRQLKNMTMLLNDLLDVSRVTYGKVKLHRCVYGVNEIIQSASRSCHDLIADRRHDVEITLCDEPCLVECDRARIEQVIVNLLQNAAKYTDPGGRISLAAYREGDQVRIDVVDTGCGMSDEIRQRAFDLFSQGDSTIDRAQGGLGLGLTMVKSLVEMHGGRVDAHSDGPGQGSRFSFWLPCCDVGAPIENRASADNAAPQKIGPLDMVIVEDNLDSAYLLKLMLERWGHRVRVFHDGVSGFEGIMESPPEVAIIDIGLPRLDGLSIARQLRTRFSPRQLMLIALTGYGSDSDRQHGNEAGFDQHLTKPVSPEDLSAALRHAHRP